MITNSELARAVSVYLHRYSGESLNLALLWQSLAQHAKVGTCVHMGTCPMLTVSPVVVDQHHRVLMLRQGDRLVLPEAGLGEHDDTLLDSAKALAREHGLEDLWLMPGSDDPMMLDPARAAPDDGPRMRVAIRFLFRTHAGLRALSSEAQTWVPLSEVDIGLARRVGALIAHGQSV
ncbi:hypothetical protein OG599_09385 [Streptomyces sp. NBC_01335]|uniref:hypothetical protein n=1 Tax=Streptomyces sp. NBC_01335 TaxID=2903828 RepID=UPI002E14BC7C|nr:hypothetical protein OG599_09385 [Streptomyces sp. NBC_01335]